MFTESQHISAKEALCDLAFKIYGFIEDQEKDDFASVSSSSTNSDDADELKFEKHLDKLKKTKRSRLESVELRNMMGSTARFRNDFFHSQHEMENMDFCVY